MAGLLEPLRTEMLKVQNSVMVENGETNYTHTLPAKVVVMDFETAAKNAP